MRFVVRENADGEQTLDVVEGSYEQTYRIGDTYTAKLFVDLCGGQRHGLISRTALHALPRHAAARSRCTRGALLTGPHRQTILAHDETEWRMHQCASVLVTLGRAYPDPPRRKPEAHYGPTGTDRDCKTSPATAETGASVAAIILEHLGVSSAIAAGAR